MKTQDRLANKFLGETNYLRDEFFPLEYWFYFFSFHRNIQNYTVLNVQRHVIILLSKIFFFFVSNADFLDGKKVRVNGLNCDSDYTRSVPSLQTWTIECRR